MKHISRRNFLKIVSAASAAAGLAACSDSSSSTTTTTSTSSDTTTTTTATEDKPYLISEEPTSLRLFGYVGTDPFDNSWDIFVQAAESTNVSLEGYMSLAESDIDAAWNLMLASGDMPDFVTNTDHNAFESLAYDGGLIPLNDLIDEYAPNIKAAFENYAGFQACCTSVDGNIYEVRKYCESRTAEFWWIRQDWLDALDLETPETVDDWYDVLTAFRNGDPNGSGTVDEVPLFDRLTATFAPDEYLYFWNSSTEFYAIDGQMLFEPLLDDFKTAVPNLAKWYKEGLVDPEIFTRGSTARDTLLGSNLGGATHDWVSTGGYNDSLAETIPGFNMVAIAPPADQHGNVKERRCGGVGGSAGWGITSTCADPVLAIKYMDYWFTQEGINLSNYGIEGVSYTMDADGTATYTDAIMLDEAGPSVALRTYGVAFNMPMVQLSAYEYAFMTDAGKAASELYLSNDWYDDAQPPFADGRLSLSYSADVSEEYSSIMTPIRTYVDEKLQGWVLGISDFEADYDDFIQELYDRGIERATEINQEAYEFWLNP